VDALKRKCSAAACAGVVWDTNNNFLTCSDASKGSAKAGYGYIIHPRTAIGATVATQCPLCDQSFYMKGSLCTACPIGSSDSKTGSTAVNACVCTIGYRGTNGGAPCNACATGITTYAVAFTAAPACNVCAQGYIKNTASACERPLANCGKPSIAGANSGKSSGATAQAARST